MPPIKVDRGDFNELPEWARNLLMVLGTDWPPADQYAFRALAHEYDKVGQALGDMPEKIDDVARAVGSKMDMPGATDAFQQSMARLSGGSPSLLDELRTVSDGVSSGCRKVALQIEYTKFSAVGQLAVLLWEVMVEYAMAAWTGGASLVNLAWQYAATRQYLLVLFQTLARAAVFEVFVGTTGGLITDLVVQRLQRERNEWDSEITRQNVVGGVIGGVFGGVIGGFGEQLGRRVGGLLGRDFGKIATRDLLDLVDEDLLDGLGNKIDRIWLDDIGRTLTDRAGRQLSEMDLALTRQSVNEFEQRVSGHFETAFTRVLDRETARELGQQYARAFVDGWSRHGLSEPELFRGALRDVLAPHANELGPVVTRLLSGDIADVLTRNVGDRLQGDVRSRVAMWSTVMLAEGVSGIPTQAVLDVISGESSSAAEYGMGFVAGVVGGAVSEGIENKLGDTIAAMDQKIRGLFAGGDKLIDVDKLAVTTPDVVPPVVAPPVVAPTGGAEPPTETRKTTPAAGTGGATPADTRSAPDGRTAADEKVRVETKATGPSTQSGRPERPDATSVRTASEGAEAEKTTRTSTDEDRPRTRPAPIRTVATDGSTTTDQQPIGVETESSVPPQSVVTQAGEVGQTDATSAAIDTPADAAASAATVVSDMDTTATDPAAAPTPPVPPPPPPPPSSLSQDLGVPSIVVDSVDAEPVFHALPPFLRDGEAFGSAKVVELDCKEQIKAELKRLLPDASRPAQLDVITDAVDDNLEPFLTGAQYSIRTAKGWREVDVRAVLSGGRFAAAGETKSTSMTTKRSDSGTENVTGLAAHTIGGSFTVRTIGAGPYVTVGGEISLATPGTAQNLSSSTAEQRTIQSSEASRLVDYDVEFTITVYGQQDGKGHRADASSPGSDIASTVVDGTVSVRVPENLIGVIRQAEPTVTHLTPEFGRSMPNLVVEAVTDVDGQAFSDIAGLMHHALTDVGAPGRETLRAFLSPTGVRNNFSALIQGWVNAPDLVSADGHRMGVVRMRAVPLTAELLGTTAGSTLKVKESVTIGSASSTYTKRGVDASVTVGGAGDVVIGSAGAGFGVGGGLSATETAGVRRAAAVGSTVAMRGATGLYRLEVALEVQVLNGKSVRDIRAVVYARGDYAETLTGQLPVPEEHRTVVTPPTETRFEPVQLAQGLGSGTVRVVRFDGAESVLPEVRQILRGSPRLRDLLPSWDQEKDNTKSDKSNAGHARSMLANEQRLIGALSPAALRNRLDALMGAGVTVVL